MPGRREIPPRLKAGMIGETGPGGVIPPLRARFPGLCQGGEEIPSVLKQVWLENRPRGTIPRCGCGSLAHARPQGNPPRLKAGTIGETGPRAGNSRREDEKNTWQGCPGRWAALFQIGEITCWRKHITTVLFDLDGTLLPMDQMGFTKTYFGLLVQKAAPFGLKPQPTIDAVWAGTKAMVKNDGSAPNDRRFWDTFCPLVGGGGIRAAAGVRQILRRGIPRGQVRLRGEPLPRPRRCGA